MYHHHLHPHPPSEWKMHEVSYNCTVNFYCIHIYAPLRGPSGVIIIHSHSFAFLPLRAVGYQHAKAHTQMNTHAQASHICITCARTQSHRACCRSGSVFPFILPENYVLPLKLWALSESRFVFCFFVLLLLFFSFSARKKLSSSTYKGDQHFDLKDAEYHNPQLLTEVNRMCVDSIDNIEWLYNVFIPL